MMCSTPKKEQTLLLIAGALTTTTVFIVVLCNVFGPIWETNDDVAMSMVAHGYGIAATDSPKILFSNVLWGYLVQAIPEVNGLLGYSIATMATLIVIGTVIVYGMYRAGTGYLIYLSVLALILTRPVLFPQFTINAGLLMVSGIVCWYLYDREKDWRVLAVGCFLAFFSFLIRSQEFLLVLIVSLPLLPWRNLFQQRHFKIATLILVSAIAISTAINHRAYQGESWKNFNEINPTLARFTDYQAGLHLGWRSDIYKPYGYSFNDIELIENWFFPDPNLSDPEKLQAMLDELGMSPWLENAPYSFWIGLRALGHEKIRVIVIVALLLTALGARRQGLASLGLIIIAIFLMSLLGRPGVTRVYAPLMSLLIVIPFFTTQFSSRHKKLVTAILLIAVTVNCFYAFSSLKKLHANNDHAQILSTSLPDETFVLWGGAFPLPIVYKVLNVPSPAKSHRFYPLGVFTLAPFSVSFEEEKNGPSLVDRLKKESGIPIFADPKKLRLLGRFCMEHLHGELKEVSAQEFGKYKLSRFRCAPQTLTSK